MFAASFGVFEAVMEDFLTEEAVLLLVVLFWRLFSLFSGWLSGSFWWLPSFLFICFFGDMSGSRTLPGLFEAWAIGVKGRVVKSKAQSVSKYGLSAPLSVPLLRQVYHAASDLQNLMILMHRRRES